MSNVKKLININIINFSLFIVLLLPIALILGPLISEILIFFLFLFFILIYFKKPIEVNYKSNKKIIIFFFFFYLYLVLNTFFNSEDFNLSFKNSFFYFRFFIYSYSIFIIININEKRIFKFIYFSFILIIFLFFLDLILLWFFDKNLTGGNFQDPRFSSFFGDEKILGGFLIKILPVFLISIYIYKKNYFYMALATLLVGLLIVASGERTAFGAYCLIICSLLIYKNFFKYGLILISMFVGLIFLAILFNYPPVIRIYSTMEQIKPTNKIKSINENSFVVFSTVHENMILQSFEIYRQNKIFGAGPKTYREVCKKKRYSKKIEQIIHNQNTFVAEEDGYYVLKDIDPISFYSETYFDVYKVDIFYKNGKKSRHKLKGIDRDLGIIGLNLNLNKDIIHKEEAKLQSYLKDISKSASKSINSIYEFKKDDILFVYSHERKNACDTHPHNLLAQIVSELGSIGLVFYIIFYFFLIKEFFYAQRNSDKELMLPYYLTIISLGINFFPFIPSGNFFNNWYSTLLYYPLGFLMYFHFKLKRKL